MCVVVKLDFQFLKIESSCVVNARANNSFLQPQNELPDVGLTSLNSLRHGSLVLFFYNRQQIPNCRFAIFLVLELQDHLEFQFTNQELPVLKFEPAGPGFGITGCKF